MIIANKKRNLDLATRREVLRLKKTEGIMKRSIAMLLIFLFTGLFAGQVMTMQGPKDVYKSHKTSLVKLISQQE